MSNIYLIEPYNPYSRTPRKKHWMEIAEEEAMMNRIIAELKNATNPENSPPVAQATVAGPGAGTGGGGMAANLDFFIRGIDGTYVSSSKTGPAPLTVSFTNSSSKYASIVWNMGDGTGDVGSTISHTFLTTGSYWVSVTASEGGTTRGMGSYISASLPVVIAGFTATPSTGPAPLTVQFTNTSVNANTYLWLFGTGSLSGSTTAVASSSLTNPTHQFWKTGSFIVTLQASGSYNQYASTTSSISASV